MLGARHPGGVSLQLHDRRSQVDRPPPPPPPALVVAAPTPPTPAAPPLPGAGRAHPHPHDLRAVVALQIDRLDHRVLDTEQPLP